MSYLWALFALISAFTLATSDALTKKTLKTGNEYLIAWFRLIFALPLLFCALLIIPKPEIGTDFFKAFALIIPLEVITVILYAKALKVSPLSLTLPFLAITPVFLIFVSYLIVGEKVSFIGGTGIFLIAAGGYTLNLRKTNNSIFEPFRNILREKGSLFMLVVAFIYSFTASLAKIAIENSSPLFFAGVFYIALAICFSPAALFMGRNELKDFLREKKYKDLIIPGILYSVMISSHMISMKLTKVAYSISVKRLSLIIGILYGCWLFREENIKERLIGGILMLAGFVIIVTSQ